MLEPKPSVKTMQRYIPPLEGRRGKLRLDFNENTLGPSPKVVAALRRITGEDIGTYPEYSRIYSKLASSLGIGEEELCITNASDDAIKVVLESYLDKGDEIIVPAPTFAMFEVYASIIGAIVRTILYNDNLSFPAEQVLQAITEKTKAIVIVNPNNPTGTAVERAVIIEILEKAKDRLVLVDEAYSQFTGESVKDLIGRYENLVVVQTFSKIYGLSGLRLGYVISSRRNIESIRKVNSPYSVNTAAVIAGLAALDDQEYLQSYVAEVLASRAFLADELKKLGIAALSGKANFVLAQFGQRCKEIDERLREKGILVRDRSSDPLLKGYIRISAGTLSQAKQFIRSLKEV